MKFLDEAKIFLKSGDGGDGCVGFRREKSIPFGGPDGGNGGNGGDIIFKTLPNLNTLIDFRYTQHFKARKGDGGKGQNKSGRKGFSIILNVPQGTQIWDETKENLLLDLTEPLQTVLFLEGGQGGLGNAHFKSPTNRSPRYAQKGFKGLEAWIWLRLKLIADVGLVGLPNAGKSTLLSKISNAKPKIDSYPFTTLHPNLGCVSFKKNSFVVADVPGLIKGSHTGRGLGHRFLGHIERCKILLYIINAQHPDPEKTYLQLQSELKAYNTSLTSKKSILALSCLDACQKKDVLKKKKQLEKISKKSVVSFSSYTREGLESLLSALLKELA